MALVFSTAKRKQHELQTEHMCHGGGGRGELLQLTIHRAVL